MLLSTEYSVLEILFIHCIAIRYVPVQRGISQPHKHHVESWTNDLEVALHGKAPLLICVYVMQLPAYGERIAALKQVQPNRLCSI